MIGPENLSYRREIGDVSLPPRETVSAGPLLIHTDLWYVTEQNTGKPIIGIKGVQAILLYAMRSGRILSQEAIQQLYRQIRLGNQAVGGIMDKGVRGDRPLTRNALQVGINKLRTALGDNDVILTYYKDGYQLNLERLNELYSS